MTTVRFLLVALLAAVAPSCGERGDEGFKLIHVGELVEMQGSTGGGVTVLDANGTDFRAREGILPGAVLLSSYKRYDVEKELPPRKDARLVFYCADSH